MLRPTSVLVVLAVAIVPDGRAVDLLEIDSSLADAAGRAPVVVAYGDLGSDPPAARERPEVAPGNGGPGSLPDDMPGWPVTFNEILPRDGLLLVQADDDNELEVLVSAGKSERIVHLLDTDGTHLPGWPIALPTGVSMLWGASFGDIDGDGRGEVVANSDNQPGGNRAWTYAFRTNGSLVPGFPVQIHGDATGSPVVVDLDGDGAGEILVTERKYPTGKLYVFDGTGALLPGWPVATDWFPAGCPGAVDVDGDGVREIFFESFVRLHAFRLDGTALPGFPFTPPGGDTFSHATPTFADLDGDGRPEIGVGTHRVVELGNRGGIFILDAEGRLLPGWPVFVDNWVYTPPTFADLDDDGDLEVIAGDIVLGAAINYAYAWHADGTLVDGWPVGPLYAVYPHIVVADLDGDHRPELIWGDNTQYADGTGRLYGFHHDGSPILNWPLHTMGSPFNNPVAVGDADADGDVELAVVSGNLVGRQMTVYLWDLPHAGTVADVQMPMARYGPGRDGVYREPEVVSVAASGPSDGGFRIGPIQNPARDRVRFSYFVPKPGDVTLDVLDVMGRRVRTLRAGYHESGWAVAGWDVQPGDGPSVAAGVYVVRVRGQSGAFREKVVVLD